MTTRIAPLAVGCVVALGASGCSSFYDESFSTALLYDHQTLTFDDRLPGAIETVYGDCHDPLVVAPETTIQPLGSCTGQPLDPSWTLEEVALAVVLASLDDIVLDDTFPGDIETALMDIYKFSAGVLPFPYQGCEIFIELDMVANGLALTDLDASWVSVGGVPTLRITLEEDASLSFISGDVDGDVDCPSAINEPAIQPHLPNGPHTIDLSGVDLTIDIGVGVASGQVTATSDVELTIAAITITPPLSELVVNNVGDIDTILGLTTGLSLSGLSAAVEEEIALELGSLATSIANAINGEIEPGYTVQTVSIVGGELVVDSTKLRTK